MPQGEGSRDDEILHYVTILELVLDGVHMVQTGLFEESPVVVCRRPRLVLTTACGGCNVPHTGATYFLVIGCGHNLLRTLLVPLLAALGLVLGIVDGDVEWCFLAAALGCLLTAWGRVKFGCLVAGGVLGCDAAQLLGSVPKNVAQCLVGWHLLCITHATSARLFPWPLGVTTMSLPVAAFTLVWVPCAMFKLRMHVPLVSLSVSLGFGGLAPLPWRSLGRQISRWWW
jgi:hypothetical protein